MERKCISLEVKDLDKDKRTATIAHASYDNVDRTEDISRKGMFTKSWDDGIEEISLYVNHDDTQAPGRVEGVFEDNKHAYTKAWFGTHTLGNDTLIMLDEKVIKWASFGYVATKSNNINVKGKAVRELKEVKHIETSVLTKMPANPKSRVVAVTKSMPEIKALTQPEYAILKQIATMDNDCLKMMMTLAAEIDNTSDLYNWVLWQISRRADMMSAIRSELKWNAPEIKSIQDHIAICEKFVRDTKASDECIKAISENIEEYKGILIALEASPVIESKDDKSEFQKKLLLLSTKISVQALGATG